MSAQQPHTAGSRGRSASAPPNPTILPPNGLVFESIRNRFSQSVATGFRNVQGGTSENVIAASDVLGNDAIAFQGNEHTVRAALEQAIVSASFTDNAQIAGFLFVVRSSMMAMSPDGLQERHLTRVQLSTDPAGSRLYAVPNDQTLADTLGEDNVDPAASSSSQPNAPESRDQKNQRSDKD